MGKWISWNPGLLGHMILKTNRITQWIRSFAFRTATSYVLGKFTVKRPSLKLGQMKGMHWVKGTQSGVLILVAPSHGCHSPVQSPGVAFLCWPCSWLPSHSNEKKWHYFAHTQTLKCSRCPNQKWVHKLLGQMGTHLEKHWSWIKTSHLTWSQPQCGQKF